MVPSHTVENYLKAIYQAQMVLTDPEGLVPMGQLASAIGVVPGTATTMVKALSDSGLARYEPYVGVRLTPAGEKLAALVLRRHRLVELFLVKVMGMSWTEVHDEAENLEHAVSDRLIDRIDEMLGRPAVDPHGDPIPDPQGAVPVLDYDSLMTCPLGASVTISRVSDQDREFLKFAELHELRPGDVVRVEERNAAGDSVLLRGRNDRRVTIGARAASKVLVQSARAVLLFLLMCGTGFAQTPPAAEPFKIADNSFIVEEAFNQPDGVFQNIFTLVRQRGEWAAAFTQEWPVGSQAHQFSYTVLWLDVGSNQGVGDVGINYRYQAMVEGPGRPAFSPRITLILPTGNVSRGIGAGSPGLQFNLPFSKQAGDFYWHANAGTTWLPRAEAEFEQPGGPVVVERASIVSPFLAASAIYRVRPMFHVMLESVVSFDESVGLSRSFRDTTYTLSPGFRGGWNVGDKQIIAGFAVPFSFASGDNSTGALLYFSYELPFGR
jgi:DtxR family Mn-dependent transcriptional regulator